ESLPKRFPNIALDAFIIMPNHIHAIIIVGATLAGATNRAGTSPAPTLGKIVGAFKLLTSPVRSLPSSAQWRRV
ncbi:MAG: transposase, partial [Chloroflexi bacterium]|nr:transposase [Chloroflexota bacterium]